MSRRTMFLLGALLMLIVANVIMMSYASPVFGYSAEGFAGHIEKFEQEQKQSANESEVSGMKQDEKKKEPFQNYTPGGAKAAYEPIGPYDNVKLSTGNNVSSWRYTKPDEPMQGNFPKFELGPDSLFMFRDNQSKPECCGSSFSTSGGCVCTSPEQRAFINMRGMNRTAPDAGV